MRYEKREKIQRPVSPHQQEKIQRPVSSHLQEGDDDDPEAQHGGPHERRHPLVVP